MTAVHQQHHYNRTASHEPMSTLSPSAAAGNNMSLHHHAVGGGSGAPRLSPGFHFPKSGLGTPDFFYAAGSPGAVHRVAGGGGGGHAEGAATPSWYKGPALAAKREDSQGDDDNDGESDVESAGKLHSRSDSSKSKQSTAGTTAPDETAKGGKPDEAGEEGEPEPVLLIKTRFLRSAHPFFRPAQASEKQSGPCRTLRQFGILPLPGRCQRGSRGNCSTRSQTLLSTHSRVTRIPTMRCVACSTNLTRTSDPLDACAPSRHQNRHMEIA